MPTVIREGVKSRHNGQVVQDTNGSPEPGKSTQDEDQNHNRKTTSNDRLERDTDTLNKQELGTDSNSLASVESATGIALQNEDIPTSRDLVPVSADMTVRTRDDIYREQKDVVPALPEGWPSFKNKVWRRRSCELVKSTSSCVRKAVSHLHYLQNLLETYYKPMSLDSEAEGLQKESKLKSQMTGDRTLFSRTDTESQLKDSPFQNRSLSSKNIDKRQWLMSYGSFGELTQDDEDLDRRLESSASGAILEVRGTSTGTLRLKTETPRLPTAQTEYLEEPELLPGHEIVDEVLTLLGRLETDRVNTQQMLVKERERVQQLGKSIDQHACKRMHELPNAVQKEHEACAIDINELRWHCAYTGRIETRLNERLRQAESKHAKLLQDLENMQKHCPLVEEKLDLEGEAMSSIQNKQNETDDELQSTLQRLQATEMKTAAAQGKASQERGLIKQDVDVVRNELNAVSDDLAQLKMYYTSNTHTMHDIRNTLKENAELLVQLERREERIKVIEASQQDKVQRLREKIVEQESEHHKLVEENSKLWTEKEVMKATLQTDVSKLEYRYKNATSRYKELTKRNRDVQNDITNIKKRLQDCAKQKVSDEKSVSRAQLEIEKVREQLLVSKEETTKVQALHVNLTETAVNFREETTSIEESLKVTADALKKQLKDEAHARTVLQARIAADGADLQKTSVDSEKKREKATSRADEIEKLVTHVKEQVAKLEKIHSERQHTISELNKILEKVAVQHNDMQTKLNNEISQLNPKEEELKKENMDLTKKIDHMVWKSEMMEKKMQDMASSSSMMNKAIATTTEAINDLTEEMTELNIQLQTGKEMEQDLRKSLSQAEERVARGQEDHHQHMKQRNLVLDTNQKGVLSALEENKQLAEEYERLQKQFLNNKAAMLRDFEIRVYSENSVKDHRELFVLQERMHKALQYYYKLRGLQNKADVASFELRSSENGEKLVRLQSEMMKVINNINRFLEANNAAHDVISMEAAKIAQTPPGQTLVL